MGLSWQIALSVPGDLPAAVHAIEERWTAYLGRLTDADLARDFEHTGRDGRRYRWRLLDLPTRVFGRAWYQRGQIATLVKDPGGEPEDTDYVFWNQSAVIKKPASTTSRNAKAS